MRRAHMRNLIDCLGAKHPRALNNSPGMLFSGPLNFFLLTSAVSLFCCKCLIINMNSVCSALQVSAEVSSERD